MAARVIHRLVLLAAALVLVVGSSDGWVGLHTSTATPYFWAQGKQPITFVLNELGSDDVPDDADDIALRRAFAAWEDLPDSSVAFSENTAAGQRARTDWEADDIHLVLFDEDGSSGFFGAGGVVAVTPLQFEVATGRIVDADILFNGDDFEFSADLSGGSFDIRGVGTHEIGHLIGLGHSQVLGATMAPFTGFANFAPRTPHLDDAAGAAARYSETPLGSISGTVSAAGVPLDGANVWARSTTTGQVASGAYSVGGQYTLEGLPADTYVVTAAPVDEPLDPEDMHSSPGAAGVPAGFDTGFSPATLEPLVVGQGAAVLAPTLALAPDTPLQPFAPQTSVTIRRGQQGFLDVLLINQTPGPGLVTVTAADIAGDGLNVLDVFYPNPEFLAAVRVEVSAFAGADLGLHDLSLLGSDGRLSVLNGLIEVLPAEFELEDIVPPCLPEEGDALVTVHGTGLGEVGEVLLGGTPMEVQSIAFDGTSFTFTAPPMEPGSYTLAVSDVSGDEQRTSMDVVSGGIPQVESVFPAAGSVNGNTALTVFGTGFDDETLVELGGVPVPVQARTATSLSIFSPPVFGPDEVTVTVLHGCCQELSDTLAPGYSYVAAPDPVITSVQPTLLQREGDQVLSVLGSGFDGSTQVELFVDGADGSGGTTLGTTSLGSGSLEATSPAGPLPVGDAELLVRRADGGAALFAGGVEVAPVIGTGLRLQGTLDGPGDTDAALLDGLAGTRLTATVRRIGKSDLEPFITVLGTDGEPWVSSDPASPVFDGDVTKTNAKSARLKAWVLPETGRYTLLAGSLAGAGVFRMDAKEALPVEARRLKLTKKNAVFLGTPPDDPDPEQPPSNAPGGSSGSHATSGSGLSADLAGGPGPASGVALGEGCASGAPPFVTTVDAKAGTRVSGTVKGSKKQGLRPLLFVTDPDGFLVLSVSDCGLAGSEDVLAAVTLQNDGRTIRFKKLPLPTFGTYTFTFTAHEGTAGVVTAGLNFKAPKSKGTFEEGS